MLFQMTHKLPDNFFVAVSGGADSMAVLHWLNKPSNDKRLLGVVHIHHNTGSFADRAHSFLERYCKSKNIDLYTHKLEGFSPKGESKENYWRTYRYEVFNKMMAPIITAHNFNDCLEEYVMCTMVRGYPSTIPYQHGNVVRPFRLWKRESILSYIEKYQIPYLEDPSNKDIHYKRNFIRWMLTPRLLELNPGLWNIVERLVVKDD